MKNLIFCKWLVGVFLLLWLPFNFYGTVVTYRQRIPPIVIFIMTKHHTRQAISVNGSKINRIPSMDRIAREEIRFDRCFVTSSICASSRAVVLTGKHSHINGLKDNQDTFDSREMTFPKLLQKVGYQTDLIGKWHLKSTPTGFDYRKILSGQGDYFNPTIIEIGDSVRYNGYVTNLITNFAIRTLERLNRYKPICLLYFHKAPHCNWMPDLKHLKMHDDIDAWDLNDLEKDPNELNNVSGHVEYIDIERRLTEGLPCYVNNSGRPSN